MSIQFTLRFVFSMATISLSNFVSASSMIPAIELRMILYPVKIMIKEKKIATTLSIHVKPVSRIKTKPTTIPSVDQVSDCRCLPLEINAREMIPDIIATYRAGKVKDLDLLTVLMQLMKDNEYEPFLLSGSYKKLYAEETSYKTYLNYSKGNEDLIIKRSTDFYNAIKK
jgi:hypothetical protein